MTSNDRLRTAVVGVGFVGPHHVDAVRRGGYADVVVLVGTDRVRIAARAAALGVERGTTDLTGVLADPSIDVVHVCTPNESHARIATLALEAGKDVVVEKPITTDAASGRRLAERARALGRHAAVALTYRGYPMVRQARAMVAAGELGELRLIHGGYVQDWLAEATAWNWRIDPAASGPSRAVGDIGTHWFDTAEFVSGRRVEAVVADLATFIPVRQRPTGPVEAFATADESVDREAVEIATEDAATILVRFAGGARGAIVVSQVSPGRKNGFSLEIAGSARSLRWEQEDPERVWLGGLRESTVVQRQPGLDGGATELATVGVPALPAGHGEGWGGALRDVLRPFYAAIAAGEPPPPADVAAAYPTLDDGARGLAFVEAVLASARSGRWTPVR
jgi:predicted dehydrogenase